jgi:hypothetical protein
MLGSARRLEFEITLHKEHKVLEDSTNEKENLVGDADDHGFRLTDTDVTDELRGSLSEENSFKARKSETLRAGELRRPQAAEKS